jgi:hypothetical protein
VSRSARFGGLRRWRRTGVSARFIAKLERLPADLSAEVLARVEASAEAGLVGRVPKRKAEG